jgi:ketosteroid isomerase-like protein
MHVRSVTRRRWLFAVAALLIIVPSCTGSDDASTEDAVEAYFDAWNTRDIDEIMNHVAEDASLEIEPVGVMWNTRGDIRAAFETMFARSEWTTEVSDFEVIDDDTVSYNFRIYSPEGEVLDSGRSEATVENGLIKTERMIGSYRDEG